MGTISRRAAALAVVVLALAGCGSSGGGTAAKTVDAAKRTTTTTEAPTTTTTTLSPAECLGLIAQAQAGTQVVTANDYNAKCSATPIDAAALAPTTTTLPTTT